MPIPLHQERLQWKRCCLLGPCLCSLCSPTPHCKMHAPASQRELMRPGQWLAPWAVRHVSQPPQTTPASTGCSNHPDKAAAQECESAAHDLSRVVILTQMPAKIPSCILSGAPRASTHSGPTEVVCANGHICKARSSRHCSSTACAAGNALWERIIQGIRKPAYEPASKGPSVIGIPLCELVSAFQQTLSGSASYKASASQLTSLQARDLQFLISSLCVQLRCKAETSSHSIPSSLPYGPWPGKQL